MRSAAKFPGLSQHIYGNFQPAAQLNQKSHQMWLNIPVLAFNAKFKNRRMLRARSAVLCGVILTLGAGCPRPAPAEDPAVWSKVNFDVAKLDSTGLAGPPGGKVLLNYEFCIPAEERYWRQVSRIDSTATRGQGRGRIACTDRQWLVIGSTQQPRWRQVLYRLAELDYVKRIEEVFWE
jgi:hypothetical protein